MHTASQLGPDRLQGPAHAFRHRLAPQPEASLSRLSAVVRHAERVERVRPFPPAFLPVRERVPSEFNQAGLVRVQFQSELAEPLL